MAMLEEDVSEILKKNIIKCIIGAIVGLVISIICVNAIPSASSYYLEAKIKVTKLQNISDKQANALITYLDYMTKLFVLIFAKLIKLISADYNLVIWNYYLRIQI